MHYEAADGSTSCNSIEFSRQVNSNALLEKLIRNIRIMCMLHIIKCFNPNERSELFIIENYSLGTFDAVR